MGEFIYSIATEKVFSTLDCSSGYWPMLMKESDRHNTAFCSHHVLPQFPRMPFGLRNARASFHRAINIILSSVRFTSVMVYIAYVIVFSMNVEEHLDNHETAISPLRNAGMTIK